MTDDGPSSANSSSSGSYVALHSPSPASPPFALSPQKQRKKTSSNTSRSVSGSYVAAFSAKNNAAFRGRSSSPRHGRFHQHQHQQQQQKHHHPKAEEAWERIPAAEVAKHWEASLRPSAGGERPMLLSRPGSPSHRSSSSLSPPRRRRGPRGDGAFDGPDESRTATSLSPTRSRCSSPVCSRSLAAIGKRGASSTNGSSSSSSSSSSSGSPFPTNPTVSPTRSSILRRRHSLQQQQQQQGAGRGSGALALQRLGKLRARTEEAFKKLVSQLPKLNHLAPPPSFHPLTPAFDLATLKRQVTTLQEEVEARHRHQEELFQQNVKLWELVQAICDTSDWQAAQWEMDRLNKEIERMQGTVQELKQQMKHSQGVRARLVAVRGEKERARVNLKVAQEAKEEATAALQQVLNDNRALEAELEQQTQVLRDLHCYVQKCKDVQKDEDMEDLQGMASMFFANSKFHMRRSFNLFTTAVRRSKRMGGISARMKQATERELLRKCMEALELNKLVSQMAKRVDARRNQELLKVMFEKWKLYTKRELLFKLASRRRLLRQTFRALVAAAQKQKWERWAEAKLKKFGQRRQTLAIVRAWREITRRALAVEEESCRRACKAWKRKRFTTLMSRLQQERHALEAKEEQLRNYLDHQRLERGLHDWRLLVKLKRFEKRAHVYSLGAPSTVARCFARLQQDANQARKSTRARRKGDAHWGRKAATKALKMLLRQAKNQRRQRCNAWKAERAATATWKRKTMHRWLARSGHWRQRRVTVERSILTRRRRALRRSLALWKAWAAGRRSRGRRGSRLDVLGSAFERWAGRTEAKCRQRQDLQEADVVARLRAERKLREALHRWRQHVVRKGWQVEHFQRLQERKARDRLQGAMTTWMLGLSRKAKRELHRDNAGTKGRQGGKQEKIAQEGRQAAEGGTGASFASSPSAPRSRDSPRGPNSLLAEIEALSQEVSRAEQLLEEKERLMQKKATARHTTDSVGQELHNRTQGQIEELEQLSVGMGKERRQEYWGRMKTKLLEELCQLKERESKLIARQKTSEHRMGALKVKLEQLSKTRDKQLLREASSIGDKLKALRRRQAQEVVALSVERGDIAKRIREVEARAQEAAEKALLTSSLKQVQRVSRASATTTLSSGGVIQESGTGRQGLMETWEIKNAEEDNERQMSLLSTRLPSRLRSGTAIDTTASASTRTAAPFSASSSTAASPIKKKTKIASSSSSFDSSAPAIAEPSPPVEQPPPNGSLSPYRRTRMLGTMREETSRESEEEQEEEDQHFVTGRIAQEEDEEEGKGEAEEMESELARSTQLYMELKESIGDLQARILDKLGRERQERSTTSNFYDAEQNSSSSSSSSVDISALMGQQGSDYGDDEDDVIKA